MMGALFHLTQVRFFLENSMKSLDFLKHWLAISIYYVIRLKSNAVLQRLVEEYHLSFAHLLITHRPNITLRKRFFKQKSGLKQEK